MCFDKFNKWLEVKEKQTTRFECFLSIVVSFFTIAGTVIALIMLYLTIGQISSASRNIQANTIYSIAKDGRDLNVKYENKEVGVGAIYNYLHSVWHQKRLGTLDEVMWGPIENEICAFLRDVPESRCYWTDETKGFFDKDFVAYIQAMTDKDACRPKQGGPS
jgi:hypothetical protein